MKKYESSFYLTGAIVILFVLMGYCQLSFAGTANPNQGQPCYTPCCIKYPSSNGTWEYKYYCAEEQWECQKECTLVMTCRSENGNPVETHFPCNVSICNFVACTVYPTAFASDPGGGCGGTAGAFGSAGRSCASPIWLNYCTTYDCESFCLNQYQELVQSVGNECQFIVAVQYSGGGRKFVNPPVGG